MLIVLGLLRASRVERQAGRRRARLVTVVVFRPVDRTWWSARIDAATLGDAAAENAAIASDWRRRKVPVSVEQIRPPVLVLSRSAAVFARGCATNSHYDNLDRARGDAHLDCAHGVAIDHIEAATRR